MGETFRLFLENQPLDACEGFQERGLIVLFTILFSKIYCRQIYNFCRLVLSCPKIRLAINNALNTPNLRESL